MAQADGNHGAADRPADLRRGTPSITPSPSPADIPDKLYFRIGEVARLCAVQAYVLRFWETEFPQLRPNKGGTGQRLFRRRDVEMAMRIRRLLYDQGYTIPGARQLLKSESRPAPASDHSSSPPAMPSTGQRLQALHQSLRELQALLAHPPGSPPAELPPYPPPVPPPTRRARSPAFRRFRQDLSASLFETAPPPAKPPDSQ